jgi:hypothetical protein
MWEFIEKFRVSLIRWNIAPLAIVGFFCYVGWLVIEKILTPNCTETEWYMVTLAGIATGIFGFLFQMYGSLQKDRNQDQHRREDDN